MSEDTKLRKELLKLSTIQLVKRCKKSRLATNGTKSDMVYRLLTKYKSSAVSKKKLNLLQKKKSIKSSPKKSSKTQKRRQRHMTDDGEIFGDKLDLNSIQINTHCNYPPLTIQNIETPQSELDYYNIRRLISHPSQDSLSSLDDDGHEPLEKSTLSMLEQIKLSKRRVSELDQLNNEQMLSMVKNGCTPRRFHRYKTLKGAHLSKYANKSITYSFAEEDEEEPNVEITIANNPDYEQQILTAGYLREIELEFKDIILNKMILDLVQLYCTVYVIFGIGENVNYSLGLGHDSMVVNFERLYELERLTPHFKNIHCNANNLMIHNIDNELFATGCAWNAQLGVDEICLTHLTKICVPSNDKIQLISNGKCNIYHTFIHTVDNAVVFASGMNRKGQFGNGLKIMDCDINDDKERDTMVEIPVFNGFNSNIKAIECGRSHSLFLTDAGNVWCCGNNYFGQCGLPNNMITYVLKPQLLKVSNDKKKIIKICCGRSHNLLVDSQHNLISFGNNRFGQLAIDNCNGQNLMVCAAKVNEYFSKNNIKVYDVGCGEVHSLCIDEDGNGYTFGINNYGQIGNGSLDGYFGECDDYFGLCHPFKLVSEYIDKDIFFIDIACGNHHNVLLSDKHQIIVFGDNGCCQCGYKSEMAPVLLHPSELDKTTSFDNLRKDAFVEKVLALQNETIIVFNPNKSLTV